MSTVKKIASAVTILMLCGCSSIPRPEKMVYSGKISGKYNKALINEVSLAKTTRGRQLNTHKSSEIGMAAFDTALKESLQGQGLFSENGRFKLQVRILKVLHPENNSKTKVITHMLYTLTNSKSAKIVFKETIIADHTTYVTDALILMRRHRLAIEGSGKRSIAQFLQQLSQL